jgi:hypothetical protein
MFARWQAIIELWPTSTSERGRARESMHSRKFAHVLEMVLASTAAAPRLADHAVRLPAVLRLRLRQDLHPPRSTTSTPLLPWNATP